MEQQHSAHTGGKDPGHGPGQGQEQGHTPNRKPGGASHTPDSATGNAPREPRRRGPAGAVRQEAAALYQAQLRFPLVPAPMADVVSWLPRARLTALGSGLLGVVLMVLAGAADEWLLNGSPTVYGAAFLVTSIVCAAWVRPTDLIAAPVAVPLAFTAGLAVGSGGTGNQSITERVTNLFPALAVNAAWLYAGTLIAALIVAVRKVALMVQQSRVRALMEAADAEEEAAQADRH